MFYESFEDLPDEVKPLVEKYNIDEDELSFLNAIDDLENDYYAEIEYGDLVVICQGETPETITEYLENKWEKEG